MIPKLYQELTIQFLIQLLKTKRVTNILTIFKARIFKIGMFLELIIQRKVLKTIHQEG